MEFRYFLSLILLLVVNICFFISGLCLNSMVILTFWRSAQLRKKLCYFMIMVLSCCDLFTVLINHSCMAYFVMLWLTGNAISSSWVRIFSWFTSVFIIFSLLALLVMNFDRYLATYYPIFHRTTVTKGKLLTVLAILMFIELLLLLMLLNLVISFQEYLLTFFIIVTPPMLFMNYRLFKISKESRGNGEDSDERNSRKMFLSKSISSCLLAVACFMALSIPTFVYIGLRINSKEKFNSFDDAYLVGMWSTTIGSMNGTFNCLIFYWKNTILRVKGMKVIKSMDICQRPQC